MIFGNQNGRVIDQRVFIPRQIEALSENLKLMMTSQENLERQVEAFKMQARDAQPLISERHLTFLFPSSAQAKLSLCIFTGTKDSDRVQDLEARVMEQKQRIIQLEDANKRLRSGGAREGGIPEERILVFLFFLFFFYFLFFLLLAPLSSRSLLA